MPASKSNPPRHDTPADTSEAVDRFIADLDHPFKAGIERLRSVILATDASVRDGVKWNAPSFRTTEYFATMNLRAETGVGLVLHLGAKVRDLPASGITIADPGKLLKWRAKDRALVELRTLSEVEETATALQAVLRQWIKHV